MPVGRDARVLFLAALQRTRLKQAMNVGMLSSTTYRLNKLVNESKLPTGSDCKALLYMLLRNIQQIQSRNDSRRSKRQPTL